MFSVEELPDATLINVFSDLDMETSKQLDSLIRLAEDSKRQRVIVSFATGRYCFSPGLEVLVVAHHRIGSRLIIVVPPLPRFRRPFEVTGLSRILRIAPTIEFALHFPDRRPDESTPAFKRVQKSASGR